MPRQLFPFSNFPFYLQGAYAALNAWRTSGRDK